MRITGTTPAQDAAIRAALSRIHDPCSVAAGRPTSLLNMGLVRGWTLDDGTLHLTFAVTFAGCTMAPHFTQAAIDALTAAGFDRVTAEVDTSYDWSPADMAQPKPAGLVGRPQAWRERAA